MPAGLAMVGVAMVVMVVLAMALVVVVVISARSTPTPMRMGRATMLRATAVGGMPMDSGSGSNVCSRMR